jgi:CRISPR-associated endonuclease Csn1
MKKILGLDLGTNSIGWALVNESETENEQSSIVKLGVRVNPLTVDEISNFEKGKSITTNAERTLKRGARRNLQRYKLRRENLIEILRENKIIADKTILSEDGKDTTHQTLKLRAKAAKEKVSLEEFAKILLLINKKRGYKSNRKAQSSDEGQLIDGMAVAKELYEKDITPGEFSYNLLKNGKNNLPDFYRSDLQMEFDRIWKFQHKFYPEILTDDLKNNLKNKAKKDTWAICQKPFNIVGIKRNTKGAEQKLENYKWRKDALTKQLELEELAIVLQEINGQINSSSNYLGDISDRSKELYFNNQTVGEYQMAQLVANRHQSLKNQVFYRQDYLDEFEKIWETQAIHHKELTPELKKEIRDVVIFYQRPLKSQKGLLSFCEFESKEIEILINGVKKKKTTGLRVCPKSSPLFQEFRIWQVLNNIEVKGVTKKNKNNIEPTLFEDNFNEKKLIQKVQRPLEQEEKELLAERLMLCDKMTKNQMLTALGLNNYDMNFKEIKGNTTFAKLFQAYKEIAEIVGYDKDKIKNLEDINIIFKDLGIKTDFLSFNSELDRKELQQQSLYKLWHLIYSYESDNSATGNESLIRKISELCGMPEDYAKILANIVFESDYSSLSAKAIGKILPHLKDGLQYDVACEYAGYRHSKSSLTKEELENKKLKDRLEILPKNSLRNPVVEKILNQMVNVVNEVIDTYGKPDEIRIEIARELKKSAKEREEMTQQINKATNAHKAYKDILEKEFGLTNVSRNDIIRYKLYLELEDNGYKTLYSNTYIPREKLFSKEFDIEHIIPQAKLFDDSFSNKTIEKRSVNIEKSNMTALDYVASKDANSLSEYKLRVEKLHKSGQISKTKYNKLLMSEAEIPSGFINRDLRDTQYIAKKAREMLNELVKFVVPTTGTITARLREDWQLIDIMQELNWDKYGQQGLTMFYNDKDGRQIGRIIDWSKRNDHRHHAMDALTVAFTKHSFIQYLNNLNARVQKGIDEYFDLDMVELSDLPKEERSATIYAIEKKYLHRDKNGKLRFNPPIPLNEFRVEAKNHLENILISIKAKNKVVTQNTNITKKLSGKNKKTQLTPRGQLHLDTVYGSYQKPIIKEEQINGSFDESKIKTVTNNSFREALLKRLQEFDNDPKKAFTGKNSPSNNPIFVDKEKTLQIPNKVKTLTFETEYTIRKAIDPDLRIDKVVDTGIKEILEKRLAEFDNDPKKAFVNLDENPIYLNKEKGITIKRVTIKGISNAIALRDKRDKDGNFILNENGEKQAIDFVNTGNNHHVAIYKKPKLNRKGEVQLDDKGEQVYELEEVVVSFFEAVTRANLGQPIIDKEYKQDEGWQFLFTMKQNEYFVFPNEKTGFNPNDIDLLNPENYNIISPNLFRVQKISTKNYMFRHHLETNVNETKELRDITWKNIHSTQNLVNIIKVRVNHIGQIVAVGEY